ncbi:MAG: thioesterase family protein [Natrialbaceae archaeon]|nr:thioesterase family protein [Natrialbaceae archaeon]
MHDTYENTVRFAEVDVQGVVFYGNYVTFQDEAFTEYLGALDTEFGQLHYADWDVRVVHVELDYRSSAQFRDDLVNAVRIDSFGRSSIEVAYECRRAADDTVLVEGSVVYVAIDEEGEPMPVPKDFREAVRTFTDEPPATA